MNIELLVVVPFRLLNVSVFWWLPRRWGEAVCMLVTVLAFAVLSPMGGIWLGISSIMLPALMRLGASIQRPGLMVVTGSALLASSLRISRELPALQLIGGAYFVFRHLHVLLDWWMGRSKIPTIWAYLRYQLFLPVIFAGPIHRLDHYDRQCRRRQYSSEDMTSGAERVLLGLFQYIVLAGFLMDKATSKLELVSRAWPAFYSEWLLSANTGCVTVGAVSGFEMY